MTHALDRSLSSLTALAAASLLLSTSPASAQATQAQPPDAATAAPAPQAATNPPPSEVPAPPPAPVAPPAPASPPTTDSAPVVAPAPAPAPAAQAPTMTSNPVVQAVPDSSAPAQAQSAADAADSAAAPVARQAAPRAHAAAARPAQPAPAETSRTTTTQSVTREAPKPAAAPADAKPADSTAPVRRDPAGLYNADGSPATPAAAAPAPARSSDMERYWPIGAAGAIVLVGLAGFALTRRRRDEEEVEAETVVTPTGRTYVDPSYHEPVAVVPVDAAAEADARRVAEAEIVPEAPIAEPVAEVAPQPVRRRKRADSPEAVMLREGPLPTGEERAELLKRMVEAEPDEANPFHTPRARMRRARLILQTREKTLQDKATERFDWRTYKPSMKPAATPVVDQGKGGARKAEPVK